MTTKLFSESTTDQIVDDNRDFLEEYVGDGKKFADAKELAKGKFHSDMHISRLEQEMADLRKELKTRETLEGVVKRLETSHDGRNTRTDNQEEPEHIDDNLFTPEKLETLLEAKLAQREQKVAQDRNFSYVTEELTKMYGGNYGAEVKTKCDSLGISEERAVELARTTPKAFLTLMSNPGGTGQETQETGFFTPPNNQRTATSSSDRHVKGYKHYEALRRKVGNKAYYTPEVQMEVMRQLSALGEDKFYSN